MSTALSVLTASGAHSRHACEAGLLVSAGFLGQALGAIAFGLVSEGIGRRPVFHRRRDHAGRRQWRPLAYAETAELYATRRRAAGATSASSSRGLEAVAAPTVIGWILDSEAGVARVLGLFVVCLAAGLAVRARFGIETRQTSLEELWNQSGCSSARARRRQG
ncbi:hypothetical protein [Streptomyces griseorubiginosus]|uniref:hypothetical protein n=1 Tax=Streptomyces griseorubiginosus TaxID=67304 RepID=UPI003655633D